ncbi:hypothetical protein J4Q44_G00374500 [Coregonus suidteri]|uniref:Uncharacterized protein n=1 Tax=Coregonus suidteri TaxID=861788 RepID=A0AAN8Q558_9TELE
MHIGGEHAETHTEAELDSPEVPPPAEEKAVAGHHLVSTQPPSSAVQPPQINPLHTANCTLFPP